MFSPQQRGAVAPVAQAASLHSSLDQDDLNLDGDEQQGHQGGLHPNKRRLSINSGDAETNAPNALLYAAQRAQQGLDQHKGSLRPQQQPASASHATQGHLGAQLSAHQQQRKSQSRSKAQPIAIAHSSHQMPMSPGAYQPQVPMNSPAAGVGYAAPRSNFAQMGSSMPVQSMQHPMHHPAIVLGSPVAQQLGTSGFYNNAPAREPHSASSYTEPPSPIASISPMAAKRTGKYTMHGHARKISADARLVSASSSSSYSSGTSSHYVEPPSPQTPALTSVRDAKKTTIFSPVYLSKEDEERAKKQAALSHKVKDRSVTANAVRHTNHQPVTVPQVVPTGTHSYQYTASSQQSVAMETDEFDPLLFIKHLPVLSAAVLSRPSPIPSKLPSAPRVTLALDLDETLVHCSVQPIPDAELTFNVCFNGVDYCVYVRLRPHWKEFLQQVSQWFEVLIFTASQAIYANTLLDILDPSRTLIKHRLFRDSCVNVEGNFLKDLHILGRDLKHTAIVDNSVQAFGFQLENGIPIESWFEDVNDTELLTLLPFLETLKDADDVRPIISDTFRLQQMVNKL